MRLHILLGSLFVAAALPAAASGGLECSIKDKSVRFTVNAGVTRGMGGPTFNLKGELEVLDKAVAQDLRSMAFGDADRPQYWLDGKDLRLILYKERGDASRSDRSNWSFAPNRRERRGLSAAHTSYRRTT